MATAVRSRVERATPLIGYRRWPYCVAPAQRQQLAANLAGGFRYPMLKKGQNTVACPAHHRSPDPDCHDERCGISAFVSPIAEPPGAEDWRLRVRAIHGVILGWGHVVREANRWRAEHAKLVALAVDPEYERLAPTLFTPPPSDGQWAHRLASRYGVPLVKSAGQLGKFARKAR